VSDVVDRLRESLGDAVRTDEAVREAHKRDTWMLGELEDLEGRGAPAPLAVVEPADTAQVAQALRICRAARVPVITYGGGSGVVGGIRSGGGEVVLSTRALDGLISLEARDGVARFGAGTNGMVAEKRVQAEGFTIGHWPQSIELATVGGLVATRSAGQFSTAYGNVEDVLLDLEAVLPDGSVLRTRPTPRASAGPDLRQLFLGSEGTLGVITEVGFSLRPLPEASCGQCFHFPDLAAGLEAIRRFLQAGWTPPVVRLYDTQESGRQFGDWCPADRALLLLIHEGPAAAVELQLREVAALCESGGGGVVDAAAADHWMGHRNNVPGFRTFLEKGIVVDTIEVAATWSRIPALYDAVIASLGEVDGMLVASAHSSHSYRTGTNLYFTFVARPDDRARMADTYRECWRRTMEATLATGGGIAHHHGIGRVRRDFLASELGEGGVALLRGVKRAVDPDNLLNPGVLLPDGD
jgi:alkyldihydroxyacetonephosphate synthase